MKSRAYIMLFLLTFRCVLGLLSLVKFPLGGLVRVRGNVLNTYQEGSNCIIEIDRFLFSVKNNCAKFEKTRISLVGNIRKTLIDGIKGKMWLSDAKLEEFDNVTGDVSISSSAEKYIDYFREILVSRFKNFVPEPEAGLVAGIVLGYKSDIGQEFYKQMITSGSIHIAVASGYNILLVGGVIMSLMFWFFDRKISTLISVLFMIFYALLAGGEPPVVRAVWMASFLYLGQLLGRINLSGWLLTFSAWLMLMIDPTLITSVSFQLSVAASYGLMMVEPKLSAWFGRISNTRLVEILNGSGVLTTLSTMLLTLPVLWWHFGRMNVIGVLSNSLILPFVPLVMLFGSGMLLMPELFSVPTYVFVHWIVVVVGFFGS